VVKDFHFASLHQPIEPLIITCSPWQNHFDFLTIRLASGRLDEGIEATQQVWENVFPDTPMDYWFLDDTLDQIYRSEKRLMEAFFWCSGLSIFIALMGILGLVAFSVEQRKKEIGIRKVLGATIAGIIGMLSKDFLKFILIALIVAFPLAYYFMEKWLSDFAYRIDIPWAVFLITGIAVISIGFLTVFTQSLKAALANPIESLRSE